MPKSRPIGCRRGHDQHPVSWSPVVPVRNGGVRSDRRTLAWRRPRNLPRPPQSQGTVRSGVPVSVSTPEEAHSMNASALFVAFDGPSRRPCMAPTNLRGCAVAVPRWWFPRTGVH